MQAIKALVTSAAVIYESIEKSLIENADDLKNLVLRLTRFLLESSHPAQSVAFRTAAAHCLKIAGQVLLELDREPESNRNLFLIIFQLVQDEEKEVRSDVASLLTRMVCKVTSEESNSLDLMSSIHCMKEFASNVHRWFNPVHLLPVILDWLSQRYEQSEEEMDQLYQPENPNFYSEEYESIDFLIAVAESCAYRIQSDHSNPIMISVDQLTEEVNLLIQRLETEEKERCMFTRSTELQSVLSRLSARLRISSLCLGQDPCTAHLDEFQNRISQLCNGLQ